MTRDEAQALAEEIVLRLARWSWQRRRMGLDDLAGTYCQGLQAQLGVLEVGSPLMSGDILKLAAIAIELLREQFASMDEPADEIRAMHPLPERTKH